MTTMIKRHHSKLFIIESEYSAVSRIENTSDYLTCKMIHRRYFSFSLIIFAFYLQSALSEKVRIVRLDSVECNGTEKYFNAGDISCFAKSYSESISTVSILVKAKRPLRNFYVKFSWPIVRIKLSLLIFRSPMSTSTRLAEASEKFFHHCE